MSFFIDVESIEREVRTLERTASPSETRTSLFNLVIFTDGERVPELENPLNYLLGKRPARVIRINLGNGVSPGVNVTARCATDAESKSVCFQEITIESDKEGIAADPGSWSPLLIRDIPVFVLWFAYPKQYPQLFRMIQEHVDKIVIDSDFLFSTLEELIFELRELVEEVKKEGAILADFAWSSTELLRRYTARMFDPEPQRNMLYRIRGIEMQGGSVTEFLYYLLWIASRLEWKVFPSQGEDLPRFTDLSGREIQVKQKDTGDLRAGTRITFSFEEEQTMQLEGRPDGCVEIDLGEEENFHFSASIPTRGKLLLNEVDSLHQDNLLLKALELLRK
ncbi:MAG: glucose-6-phosphate dehydrogenase assembly protein OpcA [Spirochaetales bacterium]|nr:glucose-6-phosphate dehydrogenase assembly protein OpcA [Spirochaetales bacterium]MCF7938109.1 glucose-6-phosphate dehydrogenase assembly protein OpcA [Spirochaetales bacterium]